MECLGNFHRTRSQAFACAKNDIRAKETEADIAELSVLFKGQHELKTLKSMYFFESAFEDLSFCSFLKASDLDFEETNCCNKHRIWLI